jgi:hypothetical protein
LKFPPSPTGRGEKVQSARVEKEHLKDPPPLPLSLHRIGGEKVQRRPGQKEHLKEGGKVEKGTSLTRVKRNILCHINDAKCQRQTFCKKMFAASGLL